MKYGNSECYCYCLHIPPQSAYFSFSSKLSGIRSAFGAQFAGAGPSLSPSLTHQSYANSSLTNRLEDLHFCEDLRTLTPQQPNSNHAATEL